MNIHGTERTIGEIIPVVKGVLANLWEIKRGEKVKENGQKIPWSLQAGTITLEGTGEKVKFCIWNHPELPQTERGRFYAFKSVVGKKGLAGIVLQESSYQGNVEPQLSIDKAALILPGGTEGVSDEFGSTRAVEPSKPSISQAIAKLPPPTALSVEKTIMRYGRLYGICLMTAEVVASKSEVALTPSDIKDVSTTFFINAVKDGLLARLPEEPVKKDGEGVQRSPEEEDDLDMSAPKF